MENKDIMYLYNDHYFESDLWQVIDNLINIEELTKEQIIGFKLDIGEKEPVLYKDFDLNYLMEVIGSSFSDERYDEEGNIGDTLRAVFAKHIDFKSLTEDLEKVCLYYPNGKEYEITEEDWNDYNS